MRRVMVAALLVFLGLPVGAQGASGPSEGFVSSFDGTPIHYYLFTPPGASASNPVPLVLRTHGWGGSATSTATGTVGRFLDAGYAVLTWDQRGFGRSGGQAEIDSPDFEGRDVRALIDFAQARPEIAKDATGAIVGMSGGSYAGGIQFVAASLDPRVRAIAPEIAWNDLPEALFPSNVPKFGWDTLLYGAAHTGYQGYVQNRTFATTTCGDTHDGPCVGTIDPRIHQAFVATTATNDPTPWRSFFASRSISNVLGNVRVPTLIVQGTIDTLFPMNHGIANGLAIMANGAPVKFEFYNSGHTVGSSIPAGDAGSRTDANEIAWFNRYLKGLNVDTGPAVEYQDQNATWHSLGAWPPSGQRLAFAGQAANLVITPAPTGGGTPVAANPDQPVGSARIPITTAGTDTTILGIPRLRATVTGAAPDAFLFFKLVDADTGVVLDDQQTPWRGSVSPLGGPVSFDLDLNGVSWVLPAGHHLALEVSTGSLAYTSSRVPGALDVTVTGTVPTV